MVGDLCWWFQMAAEGKAAEKDDESGGDAVEDDGIEKEKISKLGGKERGNLECFLAFEARGKRSSFPESFAV